MLSTFIYPEQFGFLDGRKNNEAVGTSLECLHTIKTKRVETKVIKNELTKVYEIMCWIYVRLVLI